MSLGFHITGRIDRPDELVEKAKTLAKEFGYGIAAGEEGLCIRLCPMGELEVVWSEDEQEPGQWLVEADCQTTPACKLDGRKPVMAKNGTEYVSPFPIGYRKGTVTLSIANLRFCLPGSYQYEWEEYEDGSGVHLWCDDSVNSPIWRMSIYHTNSPQASFGERNDRLQELMEEDIPNGRIRYGWEQYGKKKDVYYVMECEVIAGDFYYLITVTYTETEEKEGIIELLRRMEAVQK